jgi:hypothetical protein
MRRGSTNHVLPGARMSGRFAEPFRLKKVERAQNLRSWGRGRLPLPNAKNEKEVSVNTKADCCAKPELRIIEAIPDESDAKVSIQRCDTCQTYWQVIADQIVTDRGDVLVWDWFQRVTREEAENVLTSMVPQ